MNNVLFILLGVVATVISMACAREVEIFRATMCILVITANVELLFILGTMLYDPEDEDEGKEDKGKQ